jgi:uncharacterized DUF497 family protein
MSSLTFDGLTLEVEDRRNDYGERRVVAIGGADGLHLARKSSRHERKIYEKANS